MEELKTTNAPSLDSTSLQKPSDRSKEEVAKLLEKTILPNSEKTSLKRKRTRRRKIRPRADIKKVFYD